MTVVVVVVVVVEEEVQNIVVEEEVGNIGVAVVGTFVVVDRHIVLDMVVVVVGRMVEVRLLAFVEEMLCIVPVC